MTTKDGLSVIQVGSADYYVGADGTLRSRSAVAAPLTPAPAPAAGRRRLQQAGGQPSTSSDAAAPAPVAAPPSADAVLRVGVASQTVALTSDLPAAYFEQLQTVTLGGTCWS